MRLFVCTAQSALLYGSLIICINLHMVCNPSRMDAVLVECRCMVMALLPLPRFEHACATMCSHQHGCRIMLYCSVKGYIVYAGSLALRVAGTCSPVRRYSSWGRRRPVACRPPTQARQPSTQPSSQQLRPPPTASPGRFACDAWSLIDVGHF